MSEPELRAGLQYNLKPKSWVMMIVMVMTAITVLKQYIPSKSSEHQSNLPVNPLGLQGFPLTPWDPVDLYLEPLGP